MKKLFCCVAKDGEEIDGREFEVDTLARFVDILQEIKAGEQIHINYFDEDDDLDLWITKFRL